MDFGRITLGDDLILYLFGTPGQDRFRFMWDDLVRGAIGAIVLVDTQRLEDCFSAVDYFESNGVPFIVAVNAFNGQMHHSSEAVRDALAIPPDVPLIRTDARMREATKAALLELVQHALLRAPERQSQPTGVRLGGQEFFKRECLVREPPGGFALEQRRNFVAKPEHTARLQTDDRHSCCNLRTQGIEDLQQEIFCKIQPAVIVERPATA